MEFIKRLKEKAPLYDSSLEEMILRFTVKQGGRGGNTNEAGQWEQGKYFLRKYDIYMYAVLAGLKSNYCLPLGSEADTSKFWEIKNWDDQDLVDYVLMGVVAESDVDLNAIEDMEDKNVDKEISKLKGLLEGYANGGFDKIRAKLESEPEFFENNENCFLDFLEEK
ncbi:hypothetical protein [Flaviaesturariibacter terrae]